MKRFLILYQDENDNKVYFQIVNCDSITGIPLLMENSFQQMNIKGKIIQITIIQ